MVGKGGVMGPRWKGRDGEGRGEAKGLGVHRGELAYWLHVLLTDLAIFRRRWGGGGYSCHCAFSLPAASLNPPFV